MMLPAMANAVSGWPSWRRVALADRLRLLSALREEIVRQRDAIVGVVREQTQKPALEVLLNEIVPTLEIVKYYERHAASILRTEKRPSTFLFQQSKFHLEYHPRGVVLVLAPFNLPFQLSIVPAITALAAGNAVICKLSERAPGLAPLLRDLFDRAGFPPGAIQFEVGGAELGEALVREKPDLVFLTGGTETGRRVMALAAANLTPVILELGGKDPMIVFADAPFERAVGGAVYGAFANAGQMCVAVQRVYVQRSLVDAFVAAVAKKVESLRIAGAADADVGPIVAESQASRFDDLLADALSKGAKRHTPARVERRVTLPAVLTNVTSHMRIMREETFGPAMPIVPFDSEEEAIVLANDSPYGLNASVWTSDLAKGRRVASRIKSGSVAVNDVLKNIGNPHMPFGGIKSSGIGSYHGPEGLLACSRPLAVMVNSGRRIDEPNWFPYTPEKRSEIETMIALLYGKESWVRRLRLLFALRRGARQAQRSASI